MRPLLREPGLQRQLPDGLPWAQGRWREWRGPSLLAASGEGLAGAGFSLALGPTLHGTLLGPSLGVQLRRRGSRYWARPSQLPLLPLGLLRLFRCRHASSGTAGKRFPSWTVALYSLQSLARIPQALQHRAPFETRSSESWSAEKGLWHLRASCGRRRASQGAGHLTVCEARS